MKLILSSEAISPPLTGIGRYTWELAKRLPAVHGLRVRFYHQGRWIPDPALLLNVEQPHIRKTWLERQEPRWLRDTRLKWDCRGAVFHGPNFFLPPCADIGVATIHDLSVFKYPETHPIERIRQYEREFDSTISRAAHLIAVSEVMRQEIIAFLGWPANRITTVPNGVSDTFSPKATPELFPFLQRYDLKADDYTLCVSTLEPRKKIENLLQAYKHLPQDVRERFPLILAGSPGWLSEALQEEIERCTRQGWLRYLGFAPEADLPALYAGARLFVYPSIYEGFGLPVLEAMASGVPVVTSDRSSLPEVTAGAALLVDPDDVDLLADSIQKGLCDEEWRISASSLGLTVSQGYSWERCVDETVSVYRGLVR
jgi:alpha-1,3-rhamnosyl/mannosyltransferase